MSRKGKGSKNQLKIIVLTYGGNRGIKNFQKNDTV